MLHARLPHRTTTRALGIGSLIGGSLAALACSPQAMTTDDFLASATAALGGPVERLEFAGAGWDACLGQAWAVTEGWARWELTDYRRVIDYASGTSVQSAMRRAGMDPDRVGGCGGQPGADAAGQQSSIRADASYPAALPVWLTPHGILSLAAEVPAAVTAAGNGFEMTLTVADGGVTHELVAEYDADYLPVRARTRIDDPIFGDMEVVAEFGGYEDFNGVVFPEGLTLTQGGLTTLALAIDSVRTDVAAPEIPPARAFGGGGGGGDAAAWLEVGDGIFVFPGAYQGVAVEFEAFSVVIDGMQNDARTAAIIALTKQVIPDKPIRFVVNTHSHFDHASGLRQFLAEGATILTHETNVGFYEAALAAPRTLNPDRIEPERVTPDVQGISAHFTLEDPGGQRLDLFPLEPSAHAADMLIAHLPSIGAIVESDLLQPWINPIFAGDGPGPHPYLAYLHGELDRLGIEYTQFIPVHNPPQPPFMPRSALEAAIIAPRTGHVHLNVPDVARHRDIFTALGGVVKNSGALEVIEFPGIFVLLTEAEAEAVSTATSANHFGFSVSDFASARRTLLDVGAEFFYENADDGQILADLPDGVRIEILTDAEQDAPIAFHHFHLSAADGEALRDWYGEVFMTEPGERRGLPSAVTTGGRVDFLPVQGEAPRGSRGAAIDHIGFEVDDMDVFAAHLERLGIEFEFGPMTVDAIGLDIAFITDPAGTYIEITEGLGALR